MSTFLLLAVVAAGPGLRVEAGADPTTVTVVAPLAGPPGKLTQADGERLLTFALLSAAGEPGPAVLGTYDRTADAVTFTPRFRLTPGERYRATAGTTSVEYRVPAVEAPTATVDAIYPTADAVPANLLKFYLHFSKPMREGPAVFDRIALLDDASKPVPDPWRRTELWNADATRLTLWVHPGRIKKGVNLREEFGPVLEPGRRYTLVIGADVLDADGKPLGKDVKKAFRTTEPVSEAVEPKGWTLAAPAAGTRTPLAVRFPRPLDRALLGRALAVTDASGKPVAGAGEIGDGERSWSFRPETPWMAGEFTLTIDDRLEDLAGNSPRGPFDRDRERPENEPTRTLRVRVGD